MIKKITLSFFFKAHVAYQNGGFHRQSLFMLKTNEIISPVLWFYSGKTEIIKIFTERQNLSFDQFESICRRQI